MCLDMAIRSESASAWWVDIASREEGYRLVKGTGASVGDDWTLVASGQFGKEQSLLVSTWDMLHIQADVLYAGAEIGMPTVDVAPSVNDPADPMSPLEGTLFEEQRDYDFVAAGSDSGFLDIAGIPEPDAHLYGAGTGGVTFVNIEQRLKFNPRVLPIDLETNGRSFFLETATGFAPVQYGPPGPYTWLYVAHISNLVPAVETGSVALYDDVEIPKETTDDPNLLCPELDRYIHDPVLGDPPDASLKRASLSGITVVPQQNPDRHLLLVAYGPKSGQETKAGLLVLKTEAIVGGWNITRVAQAPAMLIGDAPCADAQPAFVVYDANSPGHPRAYVSFVCNGLAVYDMTVPSSPVLEGWRPTDVGPNPGQTFFKAVRGAVTASGSHRLMIATLNHGIGVIDDLASITQTTPITFWPMPYAQGGDILAASSDLKTFYVACLSDGLLKVTFPF